MQHGDVSTRKSLPAATATATLAITTALPKMVANIQACDMIVGSDAAMAGEIWSLSRQCKKKHETGTWVVG